MYILFECLSIFVSSFCFCVYIYNLGNGVDYEHPEQSKFAINAFTGELFLIAPVDRDPPNGRDIWRLNITAEDELGEKVNGSVIVLVRVRDVNDNVPYFTSDLFHANVSENLSSGIDIIRLVAVDKDIDSIVRYSIENLFLILMNCLE